MKKTVCELFAGVGGFRCGLNNIRIAEDYGKKEKWDTWFGLVNGNLQRRIHSMHMIVMYITLEQD